MCCGSGSNKSTAVVRAAAPPPRTDCPNDGAMLVKGSRFYDAPSRSTYTKWSCPNGDYEENRPV